MLNLLESVRYDPAKPNHRRLVKSSRIALTRAELILYDIMVVARAGQVGLSVNMVNLVPTALIEEAMDLVSGSAEEAGIKLTLTNYSGGTAAMADPKLLKRVLDNMLYNAFRHTPQGGKIAVYTEPGRKCLFIHVKDSGSGLGDIDPGSNELRVLASRVTDLSFGINILKVSKIVNHLADFTPMPD